MAYEIDKDSYLRATSAGAYYCMSSDKDELARGILKVLLNRPSTPLLSNRTVEALFSMESSISLRLLQHLQTLGWVEFLQYEESIAQDKTEIQFLKLLPQLSMEGKALLADAQGQSIASVGFAKEAVSHLSYLSSDIVSLHKRHKWLINDRLKYPTSNWGTIDSAGHSQLGFWPLFVGKEVYSLVLSGVPRLQCDAFLQLAWLLHTCYLSGDLSLSTVQSSFKLSK